MLLDLHEAVAKVCPIAGVSIGDPADKATWQIDYAHGATDAQKQAARAVLQSFDTAAFYRRQSAVSVRAECQRRITALVGAPGQLESAVIRQLNALMRAVELTNNKHMRALTDSERAEEAALAALADKIKALRACSNVLEANPPADYTADKYWVIP